MLQFCSDFVIFIFSLLSEEIFIRVVSYVSNFHQRYAWCFFFVAFFVPAAAARAGGKVATTWPLTYTRTYVRLRPLYVFTFMV